MKNYPLYEHAKIPTLKDLLSFCAKKYGCNPAFQYENKKDIVSKSYIQFKEEVEAFGTYLFDCGYQNCHIAVLGENSYEWILTHFSVTCGKNVVVPLDKELKEEEIAALLKDSECKIMVYSDTYSDRVKVLQDMDMRIRFINMKSIPDILKAGRALLEKGYCGYLDTEVQENDLASIVYTSGTTGDSKGVMLTHLNFCSSAYGACCNVLNTGPVLLVLPLHHTFGLTASIFSIMMYGNPIYINKSLKRVSDDLRKGQPQLVFVVPMILEALYKNIWNIAKKQGKDKQLRMLTKVSDVLLRCGIDLRRKLFKSILDSFGGNLDLLVSGGAPLDEKFVKGFRSFGITVLNGYGITECGPIVAVQRNKFAVPGSVGNPLCCNEVRISHEGEILVRGDNVMVGYYQNETENESAFEAGWFRTGDMGYLDKYGALHITGRIKNLIILSNGENIAAEGIEQLIYTIPYVKEAIAYGRENLIVVEVFLNEEVSDAKERIYEDIKKINKTLPLVRNIGEIIIRDTELKKTTTKKIKRNYGG